MRIEADKVKLEVVIPDDEIVEAAINLCNDPYYARKFAPKICGEGLGKFCYHWVKTRMEECRTDAEVVRFTRTLFPILERYYEPTQIGTLLDEILKELLM